MAVFFSENCFSIYNLQQENSIAHKMDSNGYIALTLVAALSSVQEHTNDLRLIDQAIRLSQILELSSDGLKVDFFVKLFDFRLKFDLRFVYAIGRICLRICTSIRRIRLATI